MDKRLSINTFNFIGDILGAVLTGTMLLWMFTDATVGLYYGFGVVMLVTNIIGLVKMKKASFSFTYVNWIISNSSNGIIHNCFSFYF